MKQFIRKVWSNTPPQAEGSFILREYPGKNDDISGGKDFYYLARVRRMRKDYVTDCSLLSGKAAVLRVGTVEKDSLNAKCAPKAEHSLTRRVMKAGADDDIGTGRYPAPLIRRRRIANEARRQSVYAYAPKARPPESRERIFEYLERIISRHEKTLAMLVHEIPLVNGSFHQYLKTIPKLVVLAVVPEGVFSPDEADGFIKVGFKPVTPDGTILKVEDTVLYSIAFVRTLFLRGKLGQR
jgi:16S rRNA U1498 N3-methylase RsmE